MKLSDNIKKNQVDYLKSLGISIINFNVKSISNNNITYDIDIETNRTIHIVVYYNWFLNKSGIQIYTDKKIITESSSEIFSIDDLNKYVVKFILKKIYKGGNV